MGEVYDEHTSIEHWATDDGLPPLEGLGIDDDNLIKSFNLSDGEPEEVEANGYMGNYGPDLEYWYYYGAVILWPKTAHHKILNTLQPQARLNWLEYYNQHWHQLDSKEKIIAENIVANSISINHTNSGTDETFNAIPQFFININDATYIKDKGKNVLAYHFHHIATPYWISLLELYGVDVLEEIFNQIAKDKNVPNISKLIEILLQIKEEKISSLHSMLLRILPHIPMYLQGLRLDTKVNKYAKSMLHHTIILSKMKEIDSTWIEQVACSFTKYLNRKYLNEILIRNILDHNLMQFPLGLSILLICQKELKKMVDDKPQPPQDWTRAVPAESNDFYYNKKVWAILKKFIESPTEYQYSYKALLSDRKEMEEAISRVTIDLAMQTIKKGSPHTLQLTKTQDAYHRALKLWGDDLCLLEEVNKKLDCVQNNVGKRGK